MAAYKLVLNWEEVEKLKLVIEFYESIRVKFGISNSDSKTLFNKVRALKKIHKAHKCDGLGLGDCKNITTNIFLCDECNAEYASDPDAYK